MRRTLSLAAGFLVLLGLVAISGSRTQAQKPPDDQTRKDRGNKQAKEASQDADAKTMRVARGEFYSMQASVFSALAHANALEEITSDGTAEDVGGMDFSLSRTLISIVSRSIQGADTSSVALGQAIHSLEKAEAMKLMRTELNAATQAADDAHKAADGHGAIRPHAKNMVAHLLKALTALADLGKVAGIPPMNAPGFDALMDARLDK